MPLSSQNENLAVAYISIKWVQLVLFLIKNLAGLQQQDQDNLTDSDGQRRSWANQKAQVINTTEWELFEEVDAATRPCSLALNEVPDLNSGFNWSPGDWQNIAGNKIYFRIQKNILSFMRKNCTIFDVLISEDKINFSLCSKCFPSPIPQLISASWIYFPSS